MFKSGSGGEQRRTAHDSSAIPGHAIIELVHTSSIKKRWIYSAFIFGIAATLAAQIQDATPTAPQAAPGATSDASPDVKTFQKIDDAWSNAINQRDQYGLELVLSPLFVDVAASGDISTRNQQVAFLLSNDDKTLRIDQRVITVRMLGDVAVANGTYDLHHHGATGPLDEKGVFTQVFQRNRSGWVCINSQRTAVRSDAPVKNAKKPSNADEPFHIPFFTKDKDPN